MSSRDLIDPQLLEFVEAIPAFELNDETLINLRQGGLGEETAPSSFGDVRKQKIRVPCKQSGHEVELSIFTRRADGPQPCIYHMHPGGLVSGSPDMSEPMLREFVARLDCVAISVDYRLAPETSYPGNIDDCYAGLQWVFENADRIGVDSGRIGLAGESAGAGLAASLAILARDRGELSLSFQNLVYPMLDHRTGRIDVANRFAGEFVWTAQANRYAWDKFLGDLAESNDVSPYASAAMADDLSGLPPCYMAAAEYDLFMEENLEYARRIARAGVAVELQLYPRAVHGFDLVPDAAVAIRARQDRIEALQRAFA
jgi:acetyl esterase/lipase